MSEAAYIGRGVHRTAVEGLALRIFDGTYDEGDTLELPALMAELGVSQTVLREAVKVLTAKGLLDARQKRGTFVRPRADWNLLDSDVLRWKLAAGAPPDFFADVLELRRAIEPAAASLAAAHRTEEDLSALDGSLAALRGTGGDPVLAVRADISFHSALLTASHNRFFVQLRRVIVPALVARGGHDRSDGRAGPVPAHAEVVRSVREGDGDGARMAVLELLDHHPREQGAGA
ncbi:FadR/GntR family transcriptional regulator [Streptomyces sp. NPDC056670]|uniref:FadR/GntR family transcriptional regulator n=1 Tax=Streptomyces sp. NPDC056670 TaxID=3345904 RepID=UPI00368718B9